MYGFMLSNWKNIVFAYLVPLILWAHDARADLICPTEMEGAIRYNQDVDLLEFCDGSMWIAIRAEPADTGSPTCTTAERGRFFFNSTHGIMQYCDGTYWRHIGKKPASMPATPTCSDPGNIRYNKDRKTPVYCDGNHYVAMSSLFVEDMTSTVDVTPPNLIESNPYHDQEIVTLSPNIYLIFDEPVRANNAGATIRIMEGASVVASFTMGTEVMGLGTSTLMIQPSSPLIAGRSYHIEIDATAIEDMSGNAFAGITTDATLRFSTIPAPLAPTDGGFILTHARYNANLGGLAGANAACVSELNSRDWYGKPADLSERQILAFLCSDTACQMPEPSTTYAFARAGDITAGGATFVTSALGEAPGNITPWNGNSYFKATATYWTGREAGGNSALFSDVPHSETCNNWTTNDACSAAIGRSDATDGFNRWSDTSVVSVTPSEEHRLICMVTPSDTHPPVFDVAASSPAHGSTNVSQTPVISLVFNEPISTNNPAATISLCGNADCSIVQQSWVMSDVVIIGNTITLYPSVLASDKMYHIRIDSDAIEDLVGNQFAGIADDTVMAFSTGTPSDCPIYMPGFYHYAPYCGELPPKPPVTLVSSTPAHQAVDISPNTSIEMLFSEALTVANADALIELCANQDCSTIHESWTAGTVSISGSLLTLTPATSLPNATYHVRIASDAFQRYAGISDDSVLRFTVGTPTMNCSDVANLIPANIGYLCGDGAVYIGDVASRPIFAAPEDEAGVMMWKTSITTTADTTSAADGSINRAAMETAGLSDHPAMQACAARGTGWYLPAQEELDLVYDARDLSILAGTFTTDGIWPNSFYWSSTQTQNYAASYKSFANGNTATFGPKTYDLKVRCVRGY